MEDRGIRHLVASNVPPADAGPRVIADGDMVRVFNDLGTVVMPANN